MLHIFVGYVAYTTSMAAGAAAVRLLTAVDNDFDLYCFLLLRHVPQTIIVATFVGCVAYKASTTPGLLRCDF